MTVATEARNWRSGIGQQSEQAMAHPFGIRFGLAWFKLEGKPRLLGPASPKGVNDMSVHASRSFSTDDTSARLQQLSDEVARIAATLARLSSTPPRASTDAPDLRGDLPTASPDMVKNVLKARRLRDRYFDAELFADPAWDILLELFHAELAQYRVSVSSLCIAAHVPATTALRWITTMTDNGLLRRRQDPSDARRMFIELAPEASNAIRRYFADLGKSPTI